MSAVKVAPRVAEVLDCLSELKDKKAGFDTRMQRVSELILPSRSFVLAKGANELRARTLRDPTGVLANKRLAAFIYGDMLSPAEPWVQPKLLGRDPTSEEALWFEMVAIKMHERLSGPASPIATQLFEAALDITAFGTNCTFKSRRKGQMPRVQSIALSSAYFDEDGEGSIDTVYREFTHTARVSARLYAENGAIAEAAQKNPKAILTFVHAVEPRANGVAGARGDRKPFTSTIVWVEGKQLAEPEQGFDRLPFQVGRFERYSGEVYGQGPGWDAAPAVWTANAMAESVLRGAELAVDPILFGNAAIFGGHLDRRPGAFNPIKDALAMYGQRVGDHLGKIDLGGDIGLGVQMLEAQRALIERLFYIDWLWLREGPMMTATEVNARKDMRMRLLAPIVARLEQEWLNPLVEDYFMAMLEGGYFPPPPRSLLSEEIGFTYRSPLALAQRGAHVEAIDRTFDLAAKASQFDETASLVLKADEMLRDAARKRGVSERLLRSDADLEQMRQARAEQAQRAENMEAAQAAAGALQAGAQGVASLRQSQGDLRKAA